MIKLNFYEPLLPFTNSSSCTFSIGVLHLFTICNDKTVLLSDIQTFAAYLAGKIFYSK